MPRGWPLRRSSMILVMKMHMVERMQTEELKGTRPQTRPTGTVHSLLQNTEVTSCTVCCSLRLQDGLRPSLFKGHCIVYSLCSTCATGSCRPKHVTAIKSRASRWKWSASSRCWRVSSSAECFSLCVSVFRRGSRGGHVPNTRRPAPRWTVDDPVVCRSDSRHQWRTTRWQQRLTKAPHCCLLY